MSSNNSHTLSAWFALIAAGDQLAFRKVFDACWPQVYGTTPRLTKSPEQAKDLAQDIFIRLWESREKLKDVQHPQSYIYILSRNLVMDFLRKKVFDTGNIEYLVGYFQGDATGPGEKAELKELQDILYQAVFGFFTKHRLTFPFAAREF